MTESRKPTRRQHHVWQRYLRPWAKDGNVACLQDGRIINTGTRVLAVEKDFYKIEPLTDADWRHVDWVISQTDPLSQRAHWEYVRGLMAPLQLGSQFPTNPAIQERIKDYATEALEHHHSNVESAFEPLLENLLNENSAFYQDDRSIRFLWYLSTQYMRTKGIKERAIARLGTLDPAFDFSRIWNVLVPIFAHNIGASLYRERRQRNLTIIKNKTDVPFITGDQPAVNLYGGNGTLPPPDKLAIYYPISPRLGLVLCEVGEPSGYPELGIAEAQIDELNRRIITTSHRQVYANSRSALERYVRG